jgi:hypothetical protein
MRTAYSALVVFIPEIVVALVSFALCRFRAWFAFLFVPIGAWLGLALLADMYEPSLYDSIQVDLGGHAVGFHWAVLLMLVGTPVVAAALRMRAERGVPPN